MGRDLPFLFMLQMCPELLCESEHLSSHCPEGTESLLIHRYHLREERGGEETLQTEHLSERSLLPGTEDGSHSKTGKVTFFSSHVSLWAEGS